MNLKKVIYLANAYSSKLKDADCAAIQRANRRNLEAFVGGKLRKLFPDHAFLLPIANSASMADICTFDTGFDEWALDDYSFIYAAQETWVLMSDGWLESKGVQAEINFALSISRPVKYITWPGLQIVLNKED